MKSEGYGWERSGGGVGGGQLHFYFSIRLQNDVLSYARKFEDRSLKKK